MGKRLKTGVVGAGVFGAFHARKYQESSHAELAAIFDADLEKGADLAHRVGAAACSNYEAFLAAVEAVTIASSATSHFLMAKQALRAGRHVYVEKPLALSLEQADALIALAEQYGLTLQVGHQERFVLSALGLPRRDTAPQRMEFIRCGPPSGRGEDVSVVMDLMIHDLDLCRQFGFEKPMSVAASGDRHETAATMSFFGSRTCSFFASRRSCERRRRMSAIYEDGVIEIDFLDRTLNNTTGASLGAGFNDMAAPALKDPLGVSVDAFVKTALFGGAALIDGGSARGALDWAILVDETRNRAHQGASRRQRKSA